MLLALNHGANHGILKTVYSGLGNILGNLLMAIVSFLGLGIILITSGLIFNIIKWMGIVYLVYLGIKIITVPVHSDAQQNAAAMPSQTKNAFRLFIDGFVIAIGNPKGNVFFKALFPQFIDVNNTSANIVFLIFSTLALVAVG